jgi:hypothetical protein
MRILLTAFAFIVVAPLASPADDPTSAYERQTLEGWTLLIHQRFRAEQPELLDRVLAEVRRQLVGITEVVPPPAADKLRQVQIWIELDDPRFPCMCYHVHEGWLRAHGVNVEKTGHVELANPRNFLAWTKHQPWMVLHELAHGYHDRFITSGYGNPVIAAALDEAKAAGRYGRVHDVTGRERDHYAATNPMEYFAEGTETYFGRNDFFPFERAELEEYDPRLCHILAELWGVDRPPVEAPRPSLPPSLR